MPIYTIKDARPSGPEFQCPDDNYILDAAEEAGLDYPYSGRAGSDSSACGFLVSGSVDQSDGSFLTERQIKAGFILTDIAYPLSDCIIIFGAEAFLPEDEQMDDFEPPVFQL